MATHAENNARWLAEREARLGDRKLLTPEEARNDALDIIYAVVASLEPGESLLIEATDNASEFTITKTVPDPPGWANNERNMT